MNFLSSFITPKNVESDSDDESIVYNEKEQIVNSLCDESNILKKSKNYFLIDLPIKSILKLDFWILNRMTDVNYIKNLSKELKLNLKNTDYESFETRPIHIGVLINSDEINFKILDGQHRIKAIKKIYKKNMELKYPNIETYLYFCETESEFKNLFEKINSQKALSLKDFPKKQASLLIIELDKYFYNKYRIRIYKTNRPFINQEQFLKNCEEINWEKYTVESIFNYLLKINENRIEWCKDENKYKKFSDYVKIKNKKIFEKALKYKFTLGIDKNFDFLDKLKE